MTNEEEYLKIQKKIKLKKGFYFHLGLYVIIIFFLFIINFLTEGPGHKDWWYLFPAASWGTAVAIHALSVFVFSSAGFFGEDWEARKLEEELAKKGIYLDKRQLPSGNEINMEEHLELKEMEKKPRYDEQDLV